MKAEFVGTRIRGRRRQLGLKQSAVARAAGISSSYLNLIEHNKRPISGKILAAIAQELSLAAEDLSQDLQRDLIEELRQIVANHASEAETLVSAEEFVSRNPGWARILAAQAKQIRDQEAAIAGYTDRQNFDPQLQSTLHEMLTKITSIRSSSAILTTEPDMRGPEQDRFQKVIHDESRKLSAAAQDLVSHFENAQQATLQGTSNIELFEAFLARREHRFEELEGATDAPAEITRIIAAELERAPPDAQRRAKDRMTLYARDAAELPLEPFVEAARALSFAPDRLAAHFDGDILSVFRRLASLRRAGIDAPSFGLVIVNAAGQPKFRRPLEEFSLPRFASICALWPVFRALSTPGQAIREAVVLPSGRDFLAQAIALPSARAQFDAPPSYDSGMLVTSLNDAHRYGMLAGGYSPARPVGTSCRLCTRSGCAARAEPNILVS